MLVLSKIDLKFKSKLVYSLNMGEVPKQTTGGKDSKEIETCKKQLIEMKNKLLACHKDKNSHGLYPIAPYVRGVSQEHNDEFEVLIENYIYTTLRIMFEVSNFHLKQAQEVTTVEEMRKNCQIVNRLYLGFNILTRLTEIHSPVSLRTGTRTRDEELGIESDSFRGGIDCSQEPFSKMLGIINLTNQNRSKIKPYSVYCRPKVENIHGKARDPRLNIAIPVLDHENSIETNKNILVIRIDFEETGQGWRKPVLDLTWFGQDESLSYAHLPVGQYQGHHFALGMELPEDQVELILKRINSNLLIKANNS